MSPDSVVLEIAMVHTTPILREEIGDLWSEIDEQVMSTEMRRDLYNNGLRAGIVSMQLPVGLQKLIDERQKGVDLSTPDFSQLEQQISPRHMPHRVHSRSGVRSPVTAGPIVERLHILLNEDGVTRGETFAQAQCMFGVRSYPKGDGSVRIELVPEIEFGEPRNRRIATEGMWRLDFGRDRKTFDHLRFEVTLEPGQSVLVSCGEDPIGLGRSFFSRENETAMLLIRVSQTQIDDLFHQESHLAPIATPGE